MSIYNLYVDANGTRNLLNESGGYPVNLEIMFGEYPTFNFSFPPGTLIAGKTMTVIMDNDTLFYDPATEIAPAVMMGADHVITSSEVSNCAVSLSIPTRTAKFRSLVNGVSKVQCFLAVIMWVGTNNNDAVLLGQNSNCSARYLPSERDSNPVPVDPSHYYTKAEIDAIKAAMDAEVLTATQAATSATASATSATASATTATNAATSATASATSAAASAEEAAELIEDALWINFELDADDNLILKQTNSRVSFEINSDGELIMTYNPDASDDD